MEPKNIKKLLKVYPLWYKRLRRMIVNLYRPISPNHTNIFLKQHLIAYIMIIAFTFTAVLTYYDNPNYYIPFLSAFCIIPISWIYLKIFPQTWDEMKEYEKIAWRQIHQVSPNWRPNKKIKIGSGGKIKN